MLNNDITPYSYQKVSDPGEGKQAPHNWLKSHFHIHREEASVATGVHEPSNERSKFKSDEPSDYDEFK